MLQFATTAELEPLQAVLGQERALQAIGFGVGIGHPGYNLFVFGSSGSGRHTILLRLLKQRAETGAMPTDWCYVNNFDTPHKPLVLQLAAGIGAKLRDDMAHLVQDLQSAIPALFESDDYRSRVQAIDEQFKQQNENAFEPLAERGRAKNIALVRTPMGLALAPTRDGEVIKPADFNKLPEAERKAIQHDIEELQEELQQTIQKLPEWEKQRRDQIRELNREMTRFTVSHLIDALRQRYSDIAEVLTYLAAVEADVVESADAFMPGSEAPTQVMTPAGPAVVPAASRAGAYRRYLVNVLVDRSEHDGAPVVYEDNPTYPNLIGRVEHISEMGTLSTDFNLIKAGALHRANGGYLLLDALRLLQAPYAWEALKRTIRSRAITIESLGQMLSIISTVSLEPAPIPLDVKVVLIGERLLYYLLCQADPEFEDLFKVAVDFEDDMPRDDAASVLYARMVGTLAKEGGLKPLNPSAVARVIEQSARLAGDAGKLTTRMGAVADLVRQADYWAKAAGSSIIDGAHVEQAIAAQIYRLDRLRARTQEAIREGIYLIETDSRQVGQINGLSVISLGGFSFGRPSRITARVRVGRGEVIDIEREVELGGPLHSKGVLILTGFLGGRYVVDRPLSLEARLVFEQSYGGVDGDSASSAELYALLSALADLPIDQARAVTGSVNQLGIVQAIGGVNEKIEGFFDICNQRGLTGKQGVLIPASNARHLMLRADVVAAVAAGKFQVWPVKTIDEGIELLTGVPAGERGPDGEFPDGSVNRRVEARLKELSELRRTFAAMPKDNMAPWTEGNT